MELGFWVYVKLLLSSAVVSSVINLGYNLWKDGRERKGERNVQAFDAALALERFTRACARMIDDASIACSEVERNQSYEALSHVRLPPFAYPETMAWKWLAPDIAARLRDFPVAWEASRRHLDVDSGFSDDPFGHAALNEVECARLGQRAWALAEYVRDRHGLPKAELVEHDSDIHKVMTTRLDMYEKALALGDARNLKRCNELSSQASQPPP